MADLTGYSFGRYRITEKLGEGGMATVYKAYDTRLERDVAIKIIRKDAFPAEHLDHILKRFEREAKALAKLSHPNIVGVIDYGDYEGSPYLVMEFLPSGTLKKRLGKPIPWQEAVQTLLPITRALQYAHGQGIIHRDIKPSNILITFSGEPMLADFGLAKILESTEAVTLTASGIGIGTPEYMAPEQWTGKASPQSDIYSLGVVFYEMVTGTKPYMADTPAAIFLKQSTEPLPRPIKFVPDLPENVERILFKALASKPEDRYSDMAALSGAMEKALAGYSAAAASIAQSGRLSASSRPEVESLVTVDQEEVHPQSAKFQAKGRVAGQASSPPGSQKVSQSSKPKRSTCATIGIVASAVTGCVVIFLAAGVVGSGILQSIGAPGGATPTVPPGESPLPPANLPTDTIVPAATSTETGCPEDSPASGKVEIHWFVGLGTGSDPIQVEAEQSVVDDFNESQDSINLILDVEAYDTAMSALQEKIGSGNAPDIIGPIGWGGANAFHGMWLDLEPLIECMDFDTSRFNPVLMKWYKTSEGQVGIPFAVYPSVLFYNKTLFDTAGLQYPPSAYGKKYKMPDGSEAVWNWDTLAEVARRMTKDSSGRNSTQSGFNRNKVVQYGYTWNYEQHPNYYGSFWGGGTMLAPGGTPGQYKAQVPNIWEIAWYWTYDAIWGDEPFIGDANAEGSSRFGQGNPFNSSHIAMTVQPYWYTCCINGFQKWDMAAMPSYNGEVGGRIDADTFRIFSSTKYPRSTFAVFSYLVTTGVQKLIIGSTSMQAAFGAVPALSSQYNAWLSNAKRNFPWVKNWGVVSAGLDYPDIPSAEAYTPNYNEAWNRGASFAQLLRSTADLNLAAEISTYLADLTVIFNKYI